MMDESMIIDEYEIEVHIMTRYMVLGKFRYLN